MFFFKPKTAYVLRISDWSADVCSTDLVPRQPSDAFAPAVPAPQPPSSTACNFSGALPTSCGLLWAGVYCAVKSALWRANTPDTSPRNWAPPGRSGQNGARSGAAQANLSRLRTEGRRVGEGCVRQFSTLVCVDAIKKK